MPTELPEMERTAVNRLYALPSTVRLMETN